MGSGYVSNASNKYQDKFPKYPNITTTKPKHGPLARAAT